MHNVYCTNCERWLNLPFAVKDALGKNRVDRCSNCHEDGLPVEPEQI